MAPVASPSRLSDFFVRLAGDASLLADFDVDPRRAMEAAGLDDGQIETVLGGNPEAVRAAVESELVADPVRRRLVTTPKMVVHGPAEPEPEPKPKPEPPEPEPGPGGPPKPRPDKPR